MKKKNKGFTLIELLAIIVILAIIAVITIPIILNVIENSRKGAAIDSAYGYKDAVIKYYVSEMIDNQDLKLSGNYEVIEKSQGKLKDVNGTDYPIQISGTAPSSGYISIDNNDVTNGCLTIGDYKVELSNEGVTAEKGACEKISLTTACDSPLFHPSPDEWFIFNNGIISGFTSEYKGAKNITIPCTIDNKEVVSIGTSAFMNKGLESVVLNDNVTSIGHVAFNNNRLTNVIIPDSVTTIGGTSFGANQLENVKIGSKVTTIDGCAFVKSSISNPNLTKIINTSKNEFSWKEILCITDESSCASGEHVTMKNCGGVEITNN